MSHRFGFLLLSSSALLVCFCASWTLQEENICSRRPLSFLTLARHFYKFLVFFFCQAVFNHPQCKKSAYSIFHFWNCYIEKPLLWYFAFRLFFCPRTMAPVILFSCISIRIFKGTGRRTDGRDGNIDTHIHTHTHTHTYPFSYVHFYLPFSYQV